MAGFTDLFWLDRRIRFISTPGHGPAAVSILMDTGERHHEQVLFCGDAVHAGGTLHQPYHLEWDHWTGTGALAAWEGVLRLQAIGIDLLCPSHGPVVSDGVAETLELLQARLLAFYRAKGAVSPGAPDRYVAPLEPVTGQTGSPRRKSGWVRYLPHLYQFGENGYLLLSDSGASLVVDPTVGDLPALESLLESLRAGRLQARGPEVALVSHYHLDHCDGIPALKQHYGTRVVLHPAVAEPLGEVERAVLPWQPPVSIHADELWPWGGRWRWREYRFDVAHWPGQTWYHCIFAADIDSRRVAFCGDSFQHSSRWNGTGGFCAYNRSSFEYGFLPSARVLLDWRPEILAAGHGTVSWFEEKKFRLVMAWAREAHAAVQALCPTGDLERDYYFGELPWKAAYGPGGA